MKGRHLHMLQLFMTQLNLIVHQFVSIGHLRAKIGFESYGALLYHIRKFEPIWDPLPETSFGLEVISY